MSWVHDDPEGWDRCCREAVAAWLVHTMREWEAERIIHPGFELGWEVSDWAAMLQAEHPDVFAIMLRSGADKFLAAAETDYFGSKAAQAVNAVEVRR